ncbi:MAG: cupin domain-containing protein [Pseudomonadota bacterium]|nr:cupin domain-containing protein [Pseudomonadota bacterium]
MKGVNRSVVSLCLAAVLAGTGQIAVAADQPAEPQVVTVRPPAGTTSRQSLAGFVGISRQTAGAQGLSLNLVIIPPGGAAKPHQHQGYEAAIYILQGRVETRYGRGLKQSVINQAGDFLYIPPDLPHQPRNLSDSEPAMAIVARTSAEEQESAVHYDPAADQ